jgi:hypothetical protein
MNQWNMSSVAKVNSVSASHNEIKFVSNSPFGPAVLGVTEVSYNSQGAIQKATILLNDDYQFRSTPGIYPGMQVFLGDVVTHELGHLFGLSHSEVLDSSMFYASYSGQSTVSFDDQTGIRHKYDSSFGKISGSVRGGGNIGVLGAHVQAISRKTGKASAVVTDENGEFELGGLDIEDTYYLYTSPVKKLDSLPGNFSNVQDRFCPASYVGSFFSKCGSEFNGKPQGISITSDVPQVDVGIITINCNLKTDVDYNSQKLNSTFAPMRIFSFDPGRIEKVEQAFVGWFRSPSVTTWSDPDRFEIDYSSLTTNNLFVKISLVSFPLGTQLEYQIDIKNNIQHFALGENSLEYSSLTNTYNPDYEIFVPISTDGANNIFEIGISSRKLGSSYLASTFPAFATFSSATDLPYLLITSLWQNQGGVMTPIVNSEPILSDNAACLDAPFTYAVTKTKDLSGNSPLTNDQMAAAAGCATIGPPGSGPGTSLPLLTLGFILSLMASSLFKSRKNFLS